MYGTYTRLNVTTADSNIVVIRAALKKLKPVVRRMRMFREERHKFLRQMLKYHKDTKALVRQFRL